MSSPALPSHYLAIAEVAQVLRVSKMTVYRLVHAHTLAAMRFGNSLPYPRRRHQRVRQEGRQIPKTTPRAARGTIPRQKAVLGPYASFVRSVMLSSMAFFLEYATDHGAGRCVVEGTNLSDAMEKARRALQGLDCISAVLRHTPDPHSPFGEGSILAAYTMAEGWNIQKSAPEKE